MFHIHTDKVWKKERKQRNDVYVLLVPHTKSPESCVTQNRLNALLRIHKHQCSSRSQSQNACCLIAKLCLTLLLSRGLQPTRLLCPWDFPGKNTGVGLPFPSPGDLANPGIKPSSLALQVDSLSLSHLGQVVPSCTDLVSSLYQFCFCPMDANCGKCFVIIFVVINIHGAYQKEMHCDSES